MTVMHSIYHEPGTVTINRDQCAQCGLCAQICPAEVLVVQGERVQVCDDSPFGCIACGHCMMVCPTGSIRVNGRGLSPDDLLPLPPRQDRATPDALAALMVARRSIRRFRDEQVDGVLLDRIVETAASAPMGIPPWDVGCVTVTGREEVQALAAELVDGYRGFLKLFRPWVLVMMRPFMRRATYELFRDFVAPLAKHYVQNRDRGRDTLLWDAPAVIIFHRSEYVEDVEPTIACTYAMLAAESLGLGTTIIGGVAPILQRNKTLSTRLGIPAKNTAALAMIVGHPATKFQRAVRRRFSHVANVSGREA